MKDDQTRTAGMDAVAEVTRRSLVSRAKRKRSLEAEMSHVARIALDGLAAGAVEQEAGKVEITREELGVVKEADQPPPSGPR